MVQGVGTAPVIVVPGGVIYSGGVVVSCAEWEFDSWMVSTTLVSCEGDICCSVAKSTVSNMVPSWLKAPVRR